MNFSDIIFYGFAVVQVCNHLGFHQWFQQSSLPINQALGHLLNQPHNPPTVRHLNLLSNLVADHLVNLLPSHLVDLVVNPPFSQ